MNKNVQIHTNPVVVETTFQSKLDFEYVIDLQSFWGDRKMLYDEICVIPESFSTIKLKNSILKLYLDQEPENVGVTQICELAHVGRTTFYYYFPNINYLVDYIYYSDIEAEIEHRHTIDRFKSSTANSLQTMVEKNYFYKKALRLKGPDCFKAFLPDFWYNFHKQELVDYYGANVINTMVDASLKASAHGLMDIIFEWIESGCKTFTCDEFAELCEEYQAPIVKQMKLEKEANKIKQQFQ